MMEHKPPKTPCGFVKNIGRDGQSVNTCLLGELGAQDVDMFTTVIIGNSETKFVNGRMVTPRGYK